MLTACYVQTISGVLGQLVTSPMKFSSSLQDANNVLRADDIADLLGQLVTSPMKFSSSLQDANNLLRADDIRLVGTTCNKSDEVFNLVTMLTTCYVQTISDLLWDNL